MSKFIIIECAVYRMGADCNHEQCGEVVEVEEED